MAENTIYMCLSSQVSLDTVDNVTIGHIGEIQGDKIYKEGVSEIPLKLNFKRGENKKVLSSLFLVGLIKVYYPDLAVQVVGSPDTVIKIRDKEGSAPGITGLISLVLVSILLFIGSAMAIMNFHADVDMPTVHQQMFTMLTPGEDKSPLLLQIPYSLGIGLGMLVFFNHLFKKRLSKEPSPLEVEMFLYEENVNKYLRASQRDNRE